MKRNYRKLYLQMAAAALALSFGLSAYAETPREELAHAYVLLKMAKHDYGGHKMAAIHELEEAGHDLGLDLNGRGTEHERQLKSDELIAESDRMLHEARNKLAAHDRERVASHVEKAIQEADAALHTK
jgi:hypothetical protein